MTAGERPVGPFADSTTRWLAVATACIVLAFIIANAISSMRLRRVDASAQELSESIAPRIEFLTATRGVLHNLDRSLQVPRATTDDPAELALLRQHIQRAGDNALPPEVVAVAEPRLDVLSRLRAIERADAAIEREMQTLARRSRALAADIAALRQGSTRLAFGVQMLAAIMTIAAIAMAWMAARQQTRLERARTTIEQRERNVAVARASELEMFASRAAHDLKEPLSSVLLYVKSSGAQPLPVDAAQLIEETIRGAIDVVDALLDYARASGTPDRSSADIAEVIEQLVRSSVRTWIDKSGCDVRVDVSLEPVLVAACARGAVVSIVANLLRNAFDHAVPCGARRIQVRGRRVEERIRIEISDDGPGVPIALRARIFEPYVRGAQQWRPGLGLGLATVKLLAEGCGGRVGVDDAEHGALFWVELPLADPNAA